MILDHLIAGYLDGDLTEAQDRELRAVVGADPLAKEAFDAAVLIHIALQCEDETVPPASLRSSVFDAIDAIDAIGAPTSGQGAFHAPPRKATRPPRAAVRMLATAAVLFLAMWLPFGDSLMGLRATLSALPVLDQETVQSAVAVSTQQTRSPISALPLQQRIVVDAQLSVAEVSEDTEQQPALGEGDEPVIPLTAFFGGPTASSLDQTIPANGQSQTVASGEFTPWQQPEPLTVVISTAYATGVSSSLASAQNVEQISASLAYGIGDDDGIGFEVGATSYSIEQTSNVLSTTEPVSAMMRSSINEEPEDGKLATPETGAGTYTSSSQRQTAQVQSAWGGAFYERRLLSLEELSVYGRAGAGLSEDGMLGYGRVTGQWMVGAGISVVLGAEARTMPFQTGAGAAVSSEITYGAVITAVTGIQVRF